MCTIRLFSIHIVKQYVTHYLAIVNIHELKLKNAEFQIKIHRAI